MFVLKNVNNFNSDVVILRKRIIILAHFLDAGHRYYNIYYT